MKYSVFLCVVKNSYPLPLPPFFYYYLVKDSSSYMFWHGKDTFHLSKQAVGKITLGSERLNLHGNTKLILYMFKCKYFS